MEQQPYQQEVNINFQGEDALSDVVDKVNTSITGLQTKIGIVNIGLGVFGKHLITNTTNLEKFTKTLTITDKLLQKTFAVATFVKMFSILDTGLKQVDKQIKGITDGLKAMEATGYDTSVIDKFTNLGNALSFNRVALDQFSLTSLAAFNRFNKAQSEVAVLFNKGDKFVLDLSKNIQNLVNNDLKNAVTSIDALGAAYQAASAGFIDAAENQSVMIAGLKLAKAGGADTGATMQVLSQTIQAYNMSASDATKVAAVLNETIKLGITTMPQLANGFAQTAVTANAAGVSLENLGAAVAALTQQGFGTPQALTGMEALSRTIISKTPQAVAALRELRDEAGKPIKFDIAEVRKDGIGEVLKRLNDAAKGNVEVLRTIIPESTAYAAALALMANNAEKVIGNTEKMMEVTKTGEKARQALDEVFGIKIANQAEKFEAIINRVTEQFIQFGEQLAPFFDVGVKALEKFTEGLAAIPPEVKTVIAQLLISQQVLFRVTDVIGTLLGTLTKLFLTYQGFRLTTALLNGTLFKQVEVLTGLIKTKAGLVPIAKQLIGLDQSSLLIDSKLNTSTATKKELLTQLMKGEGDRISIVKELIGLDKEYELNTRELSKTIAGRASILENQIDKSSSVIKATQALTDAESKRKELNEKGIALQSKLQTELDKESKLKEALIKVNDKLNTASTGGNVDDFNKLSKEAVALELEKNKSLKEQLDIRKEINSNAVTLKPDIAKADLAVSNAQLQVDNARAAAKVRLAVVVEKQLAVEALEIKAAQATVISNKAALAAETLRAKAKLAGANVTVLSANADKAESISKAYATTATQANAAATVLNTEVKKLKIAATLAERVADGELLLVQTALGAGYIKNTFLTKLLYTNFGSLGAVLKGSVTAGMTTFGTVSTAVMSTLTTVTLGSVAAIKAALASIGTTIAPFLAPLLPIAAALAPLLLVLHDRFFGTTAQVNKLNKELNQLNITENNNLIATLTKLEGENKLNDVQKEKLANLRNEGKVVNILQGSWATLLDGLSKGFNALFSNDAVNKAARVFFAIVTGGLTEVVRGVAHLFKVWRYDQLIKTFSEIRAATLSTSDSILELTQVNEKLKQGLSNIPDIDNKIKKGLILSPEDLTQIKNNTEVQVKMYESEVATNDKRIETLDKQLEKYDQLTAAEQENAAERLRTLDNDRKALAAANEKLKAEINEARQNDEARIKYHQQRNILLQRIRDNNMEIEEGGTTQQSDIGVNALQTRLNKGLRLAEEDLDAYRLKVEAIMSGATEYIDENGNKVKLDVNNLTDFVQQFDENINQTIDSIDLLYETNYLNGEEAARKLQEVLEKNKGEMDIVSYINNVNKAIGFMRKGSEESIRLMTTEGELQKALNEAGLQSQVATNKKIRQLNEAQLEEKINQQIKLIKFQESTASESQKRQNAKELELLEAQRKGLRLNNIRAELEERFKEQEAALTKEQALFQLNRAKFKTGEEETVREINIIRQSSIQNRIIQLRKELELVGEDKEKRIAIETEILNKQLEYQGIITENLDREINKRRKKLENSTSRDIAEFQKLLNIFSNSGRSLEEENKIIDSRNRLLEASRQFEEGRLSQSLKVTNDIQKRADIELKIVELKESGREANQRAELQSLSNQQRTVQLALQRQQVELRIRELENISAGKLLKIELQRAESRKLSPEEIDSIKLRLDATREEAVNLTKASELLEVTKTNQTEIAANTLKEVEYKQQLAREGGLLDLQIAKQNQILAAYDKQAKTAQIEASLAEIAGNKQLVTADLQAKTYQNRITLGQKELEQQSKQDEVIQRQFKLAEGIAATDFQKRKLANLAAKQELLSLDKKQEIEAKLLEMQIQSNRLAFKRQEIEQGVAKMRLAAEVKVQEAATNRVLADDRSSEEDRKLAIAQLEAKQFALSAKQQEDELLEQQRQILLQQEAMDRGNLAVSQRNARQDAQIGLARTTFSTADDQRIYRALRDSLSEVTKELKATTVNTSQGYLNNLFKLQSVGQQLNVPNISYDSGINTSNIVNPQFTSTKSTSNKEPVVINFTQNTTIEVTGDNAGEDFETKVKEQNTLTVKKLYDIFREVNIESRS